MLDGLVNDGIQLVVCQDLHEVRHQFVLRTQEPVVASIVGSAPKTILRIGDHFCESRRAQELVDRLEWSFGAPAHEYFECILHLRRTDRSCGE